MKIYGTGKYSDFVESFLLHKWRELYIQSSFDYERSFAKFFAAAGLVGRVGMPSLSFQPTIPDS